MRDKPRPRLVIDTNVVFVGLTQKGGAEGLIIDTWIAGIIDVHVSSALAYEYVDVLSRHLGDKRWWVIEPVLAALLAKANFVPIYFSWRPISPDPGDDHVIDCAMNAGAGVVTANVRDFRAAQSDLGLMVYTPTELLLRLALAGDG